jgi:DNA-binding NarL/FixJ family response regulator
MRRQSVLLVDECIVFTETLVRRLSERFDVLGVMPDAAAVLEIAGTLRPDAIVLDVSPRGLRGLDAARRLLAARDGLRMLLLMTEGDLGLAPEALQIGVRGIVLMPSTGQELVAAIDAVLAGHRFLPAALTSDVVAATVPAESTEARPLNSNQREILRLLSDGLRLKEIAEHLQLSPRTVETLKHEMMRRLGIQSTPELVRYAVEHKLVPF